MSQNKAIIHDTTEDSPSTFYKVLRFCFAFVICLNAGLFLVSVFFKQMTPEIAELIFGEQKPIELIDLGRKSMKFTFPFLAIGMCFWGLLIHIPESLKEGKILPSIRDNAYVVRDTSPQEFKFWIVSKSILSIGIICVMLLVMYRSYKLLNI